MFRYIVIDNYSGHIIGDTISANESVFGLDDPLEICRRLHPVPLRCVSVAALGPHDIGYRVYLASDQHFTVMHDRKNAHLIELVEQECHLVSSLRIER